MPMQRDIQTIPPGQSVLLPNGLRVRNAGNAAAHLVIDDPEQYRAAPDRPWAKRYRRPASCSRRMEGHVLGLASVWHESVRSLRTLSQARFAALHARLEDGYAAKDVAAAIRCYGASPWHRQRRAWVDLARFARPEHLDSWISHAHEMADQERHRRQVAAEKRGPEDPQARRRVQEIADARRAEASRAQLLERYGAYAPDEQAALLHRAYEAAKMLTPSFRGLRESIDCRPVEAQLLRILAAHHSSA